MDGMPKCPACNRAVLPRGKNPVFPFCSPRCRAIDLGKWLGEEYRIPGPHPDAEDPDQPARPASEEPDA